MIKEGVRDPPGVQAVRSSSSKLRLELWRAAFVVLSAAPLPPAIKLFSIPLGDEIIKVLILTVLLHLPSELGAKLGVGRGRHFAALQPGLV